MKRQFGPISLTMPCAVSFKVKQNDYVVGSQETCTFVGRDFLISSQPGNSALFNQLTVDLR